MKLLILGGTEFVGRAITEAALRRGWPVTVFHRGRHAPLPGVEVRHGDRTAPGGLSALAGGEWDAVVDTWSAAPRVVRDAARALAGRAGHYLYVSTRSVYADPVAPGATEEAPLVEGSPDGEQTEYAQDKRGAELAVEAAFAGSALFARAGLILGPHENVGRLPWWLNRIARGGDVLAPGPRDLPLQYIDVRDLATWVLDAASARLGGAYNLVSPSGHATMGSLLDACARVTGSAANLRWLDPGEILAAGIEPWTELPIWLPPGEDHDMMHRADVTKALNTGLRCRPVGETVADTWHWLRSVGEAPLRADRPRPGLTPEAEAKALASRGSRTP
ncbi:NAD-dependent epimerase/dehydratase family protein [Amycolatopsis minnesotensis]|uniref:SDR family oxidoreductase n=1 Tax=Amycolatopsis minnesotensis TaxID=337894 RepID=A0ABP5CHS6_9PSEU